ncbi:MAG TPA: neutral zinc metallopeptidase [Acidimicrobiia bacterium]|nr:neutral zinc metallopeptidase [Acidimicrobiia bacterium]
MVRWRRNPTGPGQVVDRRGAGPTLGRIGVGGGGIAIIAYLLITLLGGGDLGDLTEVLAPAGEVDTQSEPLDPATDPDRDLVQFLEGVLQDNQAMWVGVFEGADQTYRATDLVVFSGATQSACGGAQAQSGPHYCPADELVYMDLDFLAELQRRFGAAGDTAQAYILAHEVGHHVQHQLGITEQVQRQASNEASIALELQADCFAGVWLSTLRAEGSSAAILEAGDLEEALNAAAAVGDDAIQSKTSGQVNPESWTHGSSEQRYQWLNNGFTTGSPGECDTFG